VEVELKIINKSKALAKTKKKKPDQVKYSNPRMRKFVLGLASGKSIQEAGKAAGYSPNYYNSGRIYQNMKESNSFKELIGGMATHSVGLVKNLYKANLLPRAFKIDEKLLGEFERDPKLAMKHPQALTRVHRIAGTLEDEMKPIQFVDQKIALNIQSFLQLQQTIYKEAMPSSRGESEEDEVVDAEVVAEVIGDKD
jgi:hypothetical protein